MIFLSPRWDMLLPWRVSSWDLEFLTVPLPPTSIHDLKTTRGFGGRPIRLDRLDVRPTERGPWNWHQIVCTTLASRSAAAFWRSVCNEKTFGLDLFEQVTPCNAYLGIAQQRTRNDKDMIPSHLFYSNYLWNRLWGCFAALQTVASQRCIA